MAPTRPTFTRPNTARERGIALMLTSLLLVFTIPVVGLAIDAGFLYLVRSKLSAACDAAALATARNLNLGQSLEEQRANAQNRGIAFFNANFPAGYLGTTDVTPNIIISDTSLNTITVTVSASGTARLYFMRILGHNAQLASSSGQSSRRNVNIILVLDRSGSMSGAPCAAMISASKTFADMFVNGRDRLGLISFGTNISVDYPPTTDFKNTASPISAAINSIACTQMTNASDGYSAAYQQLVNINQPLALNMIVLFTDGYPNTFAARFPVKTLPDERVSQICGWDQCPVPKSTCRDDNGLANTAPTWGTFNPKYGVIAGYNGLYEPVVANSSAGQPLIAANQRISCAISTSVWGVADDFAFIPDQDAYGVNTSGYMDGSVQRFPSTNPYAGKIRIDVGQTSPVAMNLCDNAAKRARDHATLKMVTYAIGLGSNIDHNLLRRMANDLQSPIYDNTKVNGLYVHAPTITDISTAYARIASEILRLAQ
ncbi:MAG: VWA domain-containing protein [Acidobacteria bacterium]|nr:VWA domain-containing protein [Acidobacteriota bacterium]